MSLTQTAKRDELTYTSENRGVGTLKIRPALDTDDGAIANVHLRTWQESYVGQLSQEFLDGLQIEEWNAQWRNRFSRINEWPCPDILVLENEEGLVVGMAAVGACRDTGATAMVGELQAIYLRSEYSGRGWGRELQDVCFKRLRELGYSCATLWVLDSNTRARNFYEKSGWKSDGAQKEDQIGDQTVTELRYSIDLGED